MTVNFRKDDLGNHIGVVFSEIPEKIKSLKEKLKPREHSYLQDLDAEVYFGENPDGTCSDAMHLIFKPSSQCLREQDWVFGLDANKKTWSFVKSPAMVENILGCEDRAVYKVIAEYFSK